MNHYNISLWITIIHHYDYESPWITAIYMYVCIYIYIYIYIYVFRLFWNVSTNDAAPQVTPSRAKRRHILRPGRSLHAGTPSKRCPWAVERRVEWGPLTIRRLKARWLDHNIILRHMYIYIYTYCIFVIHLSDIVFFKHVEVCTLTCPISRWWFLLVFVTQPESLGDSVCVPLVICCQ